ncbi:MAG TPA: twin-arginine translocase TatA/TatE family subunit [Dehalococcoidia bacterium]
MQFLGIGLPELLLILILAVVVVGPERLPEVAAQLAKFIRQAQAYANYVRKDFTEVIGELEKEVGTSREDLKTIADAFRRDTGSVFEEIGRASDEVKAATAIDGATNVIPMTNGNKAYGQADATAPVDSTALKEAAMTEAEAEAAGEQPAAQKSADAPDDWFKPTPSRRRRREDESA